MDRKSIGRWGGLFGALGCVFALVALSLVSAPAVAGPCYGTPDPGCSLAPDVVGSAAGSMVVVANAASLYTGYVTTGATAGWLMIFNATALPANGATTAGIAAGNLQHCFVAPANMTTSFNYAGSPPELFSSGIVAVFSSTACATLTLSSTAYIHVAAY